MDYLEEAAEQLRKASAHPVVPAREIEQRLKIAEGFTRLAAIERGIVPPAWAETREREAGS